MNASPPAVAAESINTMSRDAFVAAFGPIFEHSPWVAEAAWEQRPFASVDALHAALLAAVERASRATQLALLNAHPDLAGREAAEGTLTDSSTVEQASAGLNALSRAEVEEIRRLNAAYRAKQGFPFIVCVRHYTRRGIFFEFRRRLARDAETEFREDLVQIGAITRIRLEVLTGK